MTANVSGPIVEQNAAWLIICFLPGYRNMTCLLGVILNLNCDGNMVVSFRFTGFSYGGYFVPLMLHKNMKFASSSTNAIKKMWGHKETIIFGLLKDFLLDSVVSGYPYSQKSRTIRTPYLIFQRCIFQFYSGSWYCRNPAIDVQVMKTMFSSHR